MHRESSSDARGSGFEPQPFRVKKYHFLTPKPKSSLRSRAHLRISELSVRGRGQAEKKKAFLILLDEVYTPLITKIKGLINQLNGTQIDQSYSGPACYVV